MDAVNRKWKNSIKSFTSIGSYHRKVYAEVKISFRIKKKPGPPQHDRSTLQDPVIHCRTIQNLNSQQIP